MTSPIKPATALPWKGYKGEPTRFPFYGIASGPHVVAKVEIAARGGSDKDAAYIIHAANNYPKLVEALQRLDRAYTADYEQVPDMALRTAYETNSQAHAQARSLLQSLGEG